jgi:hypothetical protein
MSALERLYPPVGKATPVEESVKKIEATAKAPERKMPKEIVYPPVGQEMNTKFIIENKPPKKVVIEYLRGKIADYESSDDE